MPFLVESSEWRLLRDLALHIKPCKTSYVLQSGPTRDLVGHTFEYELRRFFVVIAADCPRNLDVEQFEQCQEKLKLLCSLLNRITPCHRTEINDLDDQTYPQLRALSGRLESAPDKFNLACGSGHRIFKLPFDDLETQRYLASLTECNNSLELIVAPPLEEKDAEASRAQRREAWKEAKIRKQATVALKTLFERFKCGSPHEILLKLAEDSKKGVVTPSLELMLSPCSRSDTWQDASCNFLSFGNSPITVIDNICDNIQKNSFEDKVLVIRPEEYGLFGSWIQSKCSRVSRKPKASLGQLITNGLFKRLTYNQLLQGHQPTPFNTRYKRELAITLGRYLMYFFDDRLTPERFLFLASTDANSNDDPPYLSFASELSAALSANNFRIGNPTLLSFAKLLLEIEDGERLDGLEIMPDAENNVQTWFRLLSVLENIGQENPGPYLDAVRECLLFHATIQKAVQFEGDNAYLTIQKHIYEDIVQKLELGLEQSTPRPRGKRQRSMSPPERDSRYETDLGMELKRRHLSQPEHSRSSGGSETIATTTRIESPLTKTLPIHNDTATSYPADVFMEEHRRMYEKSIRPEIGHARVKVAILDTGLQADHPIILQERIKEIRTWMFNPNGEVSLSHLDDYGHGTHVTSLLLDTAPDCDIYIAQVAKDRPLAPIVIAKAINHAVHVWKVDIISISLGYPDETEPGCEDIREAIVDAHKNDVLLFAAASNSGGHSDQPAFPARVSSVFCIYAGDAMGNSAKANPTPSEHSFNFLTLGEDVRGAWPVRQGSGDPLMKRMSGTSSATPIAAGIAAFLLCYARQNLGSDANKFKQYDKMRDLLFNLSHKRNGYNVISPKMFFKRRPEDRNSRMMDLLHGRSWN